MIAQPTIGSYLKGLITYNTNKEEVGEGNLIFVNSLDNSLSTFETQYHYLVAAKKKQKNLLHLSLNFPEEDRSKLSKEKFVEITKEFLKEYGFPEHHPFAVYEHKDKNHPHIHIATPLILENGKTIEQSFMVNKMIKICRKLEKKYNLTQVAKKSHKIHTELPTIGKDHNFEKAHEAIHTAMQAVLVNKPTSLKDLDKHLKNTHITYNNEQCLIDYDFSKKHNGITFFLKSAEQPGQPQVCRGIKGSKISGLSFNKLHEKLSFNKRLYDLRKAKVRGIVDAAIDGLSSNALFNDFKASLDKNGIDINLYYTKDGEAFGVDFFDRFSGISYKGSDLHKRYSWNNLKNYLKSVPAEKISLREKETSKNVPISHHVSQKSMPMKGIKDLKSQISMIDLVESLGYNHNKKKSTRNYLHYETENDKILIYNHSNDNSGFYYTTCNNPSDKGDIINLLINKGIVSGITSKEATQNAIAYLNNQPSIIPVVKPVKPIFRSKESEPFNPIPAKKADANNFMVKMRAVPFDVLEKHFSSSVMQSDATIIKVNNSKLHVAQDSAVLPLVDIETGDMVGQIIRNNSLKHFIENSNKTTGIWDSSPKLSTDHISIFEDALDAISHKALNPNHPGKYIATIGSPSIKVIDFITSLILDNTKKIILSGDNDVAGQNFNLQMIVNAIGKLTETKPSIQSSKDNKIYTIKFENLDKEFLDTHFNKMSSIKSNLGSNNITLEVNNLTLNVNLLKDPELMYAVVQNLIQTYSLENVSSIKSLLKDFNEDLLEVKKTKLKHKL